MQPQDNWDLAELDHKTTQAANQLTLEDEMDEIIWNGKMRQLIAGREDNPISKNDHHLLKDQCKFDETPIDNGEEEYGKLGTEAIEKNIPKQCLNKDQILKNKTIR